MRRRSRDGTRSHLSQGECHNQVRRGSITGAKPEAKGVAQMKLGLMLQIGAGVLADGRTARWSDLREMAQVAEGIGFDVLFAPDHLLFRESPPENDVQVEMPAGKTRGIWGGLGRCSLLSRKRRSASSWAPSSPATASATRPCSQRWRSRWMR